MSLRKRFCYGVAAGLLWVVGLGAQTTLRVGDTSQLAADFTVLGEKPGYLAGCSVVVGDVNGDGLGDLIYGVPFSTHTSGYNQSGEVHIFFAHRTRKGQDVQQVVRFSNMPNVYITGENAGDWLGNSLAVGDVNGDGLDDLIIGAGGYTPTGRSRAGSVFVLFGRKTWPTAYVLRAKRADIQIIGAHFTDRLGGHKVHSPDTQSGQSVTAGDINGDGIDDLIVAAPDATFTIGQTQRTLAGAVYVLFGRKNWNPPFKLDLLTGQPDITIYSKYPNGRLGGCVDTGDLNGDGIVDLVMGEAEGNALGGSAAGNVYVFWGRKTWTPPVVLDLATVKADLTLHGDNQWDQLGYSLDLADVTADGIDDLIVGAWRHDPILGSRTQGGRVYVVYGRKNWARNAVIDFNATLGDLNFLGDQSGGLLGARCRAGDLDADGVADIVFTAPSDDVGTRTDAGRLWVYRGGLPYPPFHVFDLGGTSTLWPAEWRVDGGIANDHLGWTLAVGDVNGDGVDDLVQGGNCVTFTPNDRRGKVVVTYGGPLWLTSAPKVGTAVGLKLRSGINPNALYVAVASFGAAGNAGIAVTPTRRIPVDPDPLFFFTLFGNPNPIFKGFGFGAFKLDGKGEATLTVNLPNDPVLVGITLYYTAVILKAGAPQGIAVIANRVHATTTN